MWLKRFWQEAKVHRHIQICLLILDNLVLAELFLKIKRHSRINCIAFNMWFLDTRQIFHQAALSFSFKHNMEYADNKTRPMLRPNLGSSEYGGNKMCIEEKNQFFTLWVCSLKGLNRAQIFCLLHFSSVTNNLCESLRKKKMDIAW